MVWKTIAHYEITAKLSEGGMGVAYPGLDLLRPCPTPLCLLRPHQPGRPIPVTGATPRRACSPNSWHAEAALRLCPPKGIDESE